mmetsp:Transcript_1587/g.4467  ORF Transcript_1587/g.4467 Transcript_1587/m.4467 type:complete len:259 (-) Transcript_1587:1342-2118(-)|eukprot:CAMPEP_0185167978 /NCGR_PEP_ID=MMETSP1139-20130426/15160_1 /TAXON_ID=298111 /ORGANISM="Pavlova sp., Strain CCMP459" /LENGTH=258 /DNA_ID=CAMNT_0027733475 /DNA_START=98 /DNA_END=874 /DNA_ORIENTATION=+
MRAPVVQRGPIRSRRLLEKFVSAPRPQRAASAPVRESYWRYDGEEDQGKKQPKKTGRRPAARSVRAPPSPACDDPGSPCSTSEARTEPFILATAPAKAAHAAADTKRGAGHKRPLHLASTTATGSARRALAESPRKVAKHSHPAREEEDSNVRVVDTALVVMALEAAHSANKSASSQLPPGWHFDARPVRGDPRSRALVCKCGHRARSAQAAARHLALGLDECTVVLPVADPFLSLPMAPVKLGRWQHKHDQGLIPSD